MALTTTTANFTVPAVGSTVVIAVADTSWMVVAEALVIESAGFYEITAIGGATSVTARNLGYASNAAPAAIIASGSEVNSGSVVGSESWNNYSGGSPTTTKGDIIADNGANAPRPSTVRKAVGTDGQILVGDSAQPTGLNYVSVLPNTVTNDNNIPRYDGVAGTPMVLQDSKLLISDTGAIQSTPTGGNARGANAIDLQVTRTNNTEVASGTTSVICGGSGNTASGTRSSILGGQNHIASATNDSVCGGSGNTASGGNSFVGAGSGNVASAGESSVGGGSFNTASGGSSTVAGGTLNTASALNSMVAGGDNNAASAASAAVLGGSSNTASAQNSVTVGGQYALANKYGQVAHASGRFAAQGDCQESALILRNSTTDATATVLYLDGGTTPLRATVPNNTSWMVHGLLTARRSTGATGVREFKCGIENTAGVTALKGAATITTIGTDDAGITIAAVTVTADDPNDALAITVTGAVGQTIRWGCSLRIMEVAH